MAHSTQVSGDRAEVFNDLDLLVLLALMTSELENQPSKYPALQPYRAVWEECRLAYASGVINLRLDDMMSHVAAREQVKQVLSAVERRLERSGETLPADQLNSEWPVPGVTFYDYKTSFVENAVKQLRRLINGG